MDMDFCIMLNVNAKKKKSSPSGNISPNMRLFQKTVSKVQEYKLERTHSLIGHPNYWAPEYGSEQGYGVLSDLWALGVCMYELSTGHFPFGDQGDDTYEILGKITNDPLEFPNTLRVKPGSDVFINFLSLLMSKNQNKRPGPAWSGQKGDYQELKKHSYFEDFNFVNFTRKKLEPPYKPKTEELMQKDHILGMQAIDNPLDDPTHKFKLG
jgi:serine/threonine protein kinase